MTRMLLDGPEDARLVERARGGSGRARRRLCRRMRKDLYPLAYAWTGHPFSATRAVRVATRSALRDPSRPYTSAVIAALHRQTRARTTADAADNSGAFARAVTVLCDERRLPPSAAAALLGLSPAQVAEHHRAGREALGLGAVDARIPRCAGWALVSRDEEELTAAERSAAAGHLELCHACRDGLASRRRARRALRASGVVGGGGAVAVAAVAVDGVLTAAGPVTVAGGIAVTGGLGVAIGQVAQHHHPASDRPTAVSVPSDRPSAKPRATTKRDNGASARPAAGSGTTSGNGVPAAPTPAPGDAKVSDPAASVAPQQNDGPAPVTSPTLVDLPSPLSSLLPVPLPSVPLPLPSQLMTPAPLASLLPPLPLPLPSPPKLPLPSLPKLPLG